uniref:Small integral membrane protein 13-like n=1 Tax=Dermatophagoides pteronyssinus TaxID=6956 RepID=A0A6P6YEX7_DERPT|nr:small integral membrane protein 13-like [Dermatophagoides pteronyssinus]
MTDLILSFMIFVGSILFVILLIFLGWYCVWKFFLCRFRLVRELFRLNEQQQHQSPNSSNSRLRNQSVTKVRPPKID